MSVILSVVWSLFFWIFFPIDAIAKDFSDDDQARARERQIQLQQKDTFRQSFRDEAAAFEALESFSEGASVVSPTVNELEGDLPSFFITSIDISGATLLSTFELRRIKRPYLGQRLTINEINALVKDLTELYFSKGYITTRIYIVPQNLKQGFLKLEVVEGYVEGYEYDGFVSEVLFAFPWTKGRPFNLKHIEQGLEQLNRLNQNNAVMKIIPSKSAIGAGIVRIQNAKSSPGSASIRYDTYSNPDISALPNSFDVTRENIFAVNDQWNLNYFQRFKEHHQFNNSLSISSSIPWGYFTSNFSYSRFEYMTLVNGSTINFLSSGQTDSMGLSVDMVAKRSKKSKTTLSVGLSSKDTVAYVEDTISSSGTRKLVHLNVKAQQTHTNRFGNWTGILNYIQGISRLGATITNDAGLYDEHAQFKKMVGDVYWVKMNRAGPYTIRFKSSLHAQYANRTLYSTDRISLGGFSSVRGFSVSEQGDSGFYWRNEWHIPNLVFYPKYTSMMLAYDVGAVYKYTGQKIELRHWDTAMSGAAIGVTFAKGRLNMNLTYGIPVNYSSQLDPADSVTTFATTFGLM